MNSSFILFLCFLIISVNKTLIRSKFGVQIWFGILISVFAVSIQNQTMGQEVVRVDNTQTLKRLLTQEDTDRDKRITIEDRGPRKFVVQTITENAYQVSGIYRLSNLLQELALAIERKENTTVLRMERIFENPVKRISRMIRTQFWDGLTRRIDQEGLARITVDSKTKGDQPRIYVPYSDLRSLKYYQQIANNKHHLNLEVIRLPETITPEYVHSINGNPGLLALDLELDSLGQLKGAPFVVPGGRFNEMYGWDSYFIALGLLEDGRVKLARSMINNFVYQINYYGKILNANRSYYLTRSQPPFLTSMALAVYEKLPNKNDNRSWLAKVFRAAIHEYKTVWMSNERQTSTGLNRYFGSGIGMPPETESGHFDSIIKPFSDKALLDVTEYSARYNAGQIKEPNLDLFFIHDRAVRESGHDTSYRLVEAADINTVDLNSLIYKYEIDIAKTIKVHFQDSLSMPDGSTEHSDIWYKRAETRKQSINDLMWDNDRGMFFDFNFVRNHKTNFESATTFYPLWSGIATLKQVEALLVKALPLLEAPGGILSGTEKSRGPISINRPQRQWDYPNGWAPHQMIVWQGLLNYGYKKIAQRLIYRWLYMITRNAVDFNGTVPEKFDVVNRTHKVFAEYGNVGTDFDYITREGFGWMNSSYQVGYKLLSTDQRVALEALIPPEWLFGPVKNDTSQR